MNQNTLTGRLGRDPEVRFLQDGTPVANFSLAVNEVWTRDGKKQERVDWIDCVAFGRRAEVIGEYLSKGSRVLVNGKLRERKFEANRTIEHEGEEITVKVPMKKLEILTLNFEFLDPPKSSQKSETSAETSESEGETEQESPKQEATVSEPEGDDPY